ncbi:MAG: NUDIX domain-containing protein [Bacteroidales bacterium]|nr:NUDIX domain-containing protein [Bacteroidales bacterium]
MYKVFFNDRKLFLTDNFAKHFEVKYGLFYKYRETEDLRELISFYSKLTRIDTLYLFHKDIEELREEFTRCFIPVNAGGGLVRNQKGEYLLIHRRGRWDLPKGKLEKKESFEDGALREVREETGLKKIVLDRPLISTYHTYPYKEGVALKKTMWFEMSFSGTEMPVPQAQEQITDVHWVPADKLEYYLQNTYPAIRDVFTYYGV